MNKLIELHFMAPVSSSPQLCVFPYLSMDDFWLFPHFCYAEGVANHTVVAAGVILGGSLVGYLHCRLLVPSTCLLGCA